MLLAANNQKVSLKWFKKIRALKGKAFLPPCPPATPLGFRMAVNQWQIAKPWQAFSELLYRLAFEIQKAKPMRLKKVNSIRTEFLLEVVTGSMMSSQSPCPALSPLPPLLCWLSSWTGCLLVVVSFWFSGEPQADMTAPLTKETVLICLRLTAEFFSLTTSSTRILSQVRHWHVDQDHQAPYQLYFVVGYRK